MLSVIIIAKNEASRIKACLESIKWVDEIIFSDSGSTDSTIEIAKKYTDKILSFRDVDFSSIRNKSMDKATGEWVLYVDADERVMQSLYEEIQKVIEKNDFSAYAISRKNIIFGQEVSYGPYKKDWVVRLFKRSEFINWTGRIHESANYKGKLGFLKNPLLHLTHRDIDHIVLKSLEWSKIDAEVRLKTNHPPMSSWRFARILISELWHQGVTRRGFFNGTVGMIDSILQVFSLYITYVRLWQLQQPQDLEKVYEDIDKTLIETSFKGK